MYLNLDKPIRPLSPYPCLDFMFNQIDNSAYGAQNLDMYVPYGFESIPKNKTNLAQGIETEVQPYEIPSKITSDEISHRL